MWVGVYVCVHSNTKIIGHVVAQLGRRIVNDKFWSPVLLEEVKRLNVKVGVNLHF